MLKANYIKIEEIKILKKRLLLYKLSYSSYYRKALKGKLAL